MLCNVLAVYSTLSKKTMPNIQWINFVDVRRQARLNAMFTLLLEALDWIYIGYSAFAFPRVCVDRDLAPTMVTWNLLLASQAGLSSRITAGAPWQTWKDRGRGAKQVFEIAKLPGEPVTTTGAKAELHAPSLESGTARNVFAGNEARNSLTW